MKTMANGVIEHLRTIGFESENGAATLACHMTVQIVHEDGGFRVDIAIQSGETINCIQLRTADLDFSSAGLDAGTLADIYAQPGGYRIKP